MKIKTGILGGTFAPIHKGHINIAKQALQACDLDEVWFNVAGIPPHKSISDSIGRFVRYEMTKIALCNEDKLFVKDFELFDLKKSYTADSLEILTGKYPDREFFFIMGEDSLDSFTHWYKPEKILSYATILVAARSDSTKAKQLFSKIGHLNEAFPGKFIHVPTTYVPISSSRIREEISQENVSLVKEYLPSGVLDYILQRRLFMNTDITYDVNYFREEIKKTLKEKRFYHSLRVADTAASMAIVLGYPMHIAYVAGLLHDCGKYMPDSELLNYCDTNGISVPPSQREASYLLHGPVGAHIAKTKYGISDEEILESIRVHTIGKANMSLLDKIIFTADYIEPERSRSKMLSKIREMTFKNLDLAIIMILEDTFDYLRETNRPIDPQALEAYDFLREKQDRKESPWK